ncbi:unnamed protein product [Cuscuta epithymum]|uniref:Uncharacterized protein n=1 Tax=Cuscuta epithymum TaxID=186058 RepID=A0AAV0C8M8_9ASTE|nr:unnamed protein product [Cuscuta epithymum]
MTYLVHICQLNDIDDEDVKICSSREIGERRRRPMEGSGVRWRAAEAGGGRWRWLINRGWQRATLVHGISSLVS